MVWERKVKGIQLPLQQKQTKSVLAAVLFPSYKALLRLQQQRLSALLKGEQGRK